MTLQAPPLVFVYNAEAGLLNGLLDLGHKLVSPSTYPCSLCAVTYSSFGMKRPWQDFVNGLGRPVRFAYRDQIRDEYGMTEVTLPAVFEEKDGRLEPWLTAEQLNGCRSLDELMELVSRRLAAG